MLLAEVVRSSQAVAGTASRTAKRAALADLLRRVDTGDVAVVVTYLAGELRQRRTGIGWASMRSLPDPAAEATLTVQEADAGFARIAALSGAGSAAGRAGALRDLFARATADEQTFLRNLLAGEVRQGALDSIMLDAVAEASALSSSAVRRAAMLAGATAPVAVAALTVGAAGVEAFTLSVGRPIRPMLAASAAGIEAAFVKLKVLTETDAAQEVSVDLKLDGIRVQAHKDGDVVGLYTRSLDDITARLPEVVEALRALPARRLVLDGEVIALGPEGRPRPFQQTAARTASAAPTLPTVQVTPFFFDCLYVDGQDLLERPLRERMAVLDATVGDLAVPRVRSAHHAEAQAFFDDAIARGHEGVVLKDLAAPYEAGRRGAAWVKVKPRHTLDLVVLAVEWGSGRRRGWLSNIHLGARDAGGGFVMLGKTFKGMTDEMLTWQTRRFLELEESRTSFVVSVRPEQVVEVAFDGLQRSTRYPGGFALRFARVIRYRDDKTAAEADTIDTVRALA